MPDLSTLMQMMNEMKSKMPPNTSDCSQTNSKMPPDASDCSHHPSEVDDSMPDMETMMKFAKMMSAMNSRKNHAETNLLYALKPFLRGSKKEKLDQYVEVLKISSLLNEMNQSGGDHV